MNLINTEILKMYDKEKSELDILFDGRIDTLGTYSLANNINNYKAVIIYHVYSNSMRNAGSMYIPKQKYSSETQSYQCSHGNGDLMCSVSFYFSEERNSMVVDGYSGELITGVYGVK